MSNHQKTDLSTIISAVRKDAKSWRNWSTILIKIDEQKDRDRFTRNYHQINAMLNGMKYMLEKRIYICATTDIHIFLKDSHIEQMTDISELLIRHLMNMFNIESDISSYNLAHDYHAYLARIFDSHDINHGMSLDQYEALKPFDISIIKKPSMAFIDYADTDSLDPLPRYKRTKVMLIEDDKTIQLSVNKAIGHVCKLRMVDCANQAFAALTSFQPDVIFLDINLPDKNGHNVLDWIMHNDPGATVVMFSSNNDIDNISYSLARGAKGFISKPFKKSDLLAYIN